MPSYCKVELLGVLNCEPQTRETQNGLVCAFSISVTQEVVNSFNAVVNETCSIDVEVPGKNGTLVQEFFHAGSQIFIDGTLKQDVTRDRMTGRNIRRTYVMATSVQAPEVSEGPVPEPTPEYADSVTIPSAPVAKGNVGMQQGGNMTF